MLSNEFSSRSGSELQRLLAVEESREMEEDVSRLKSLAVGFLNDMGGGGASLPEDVISEVCRFGAGEIHCVASIVGGIASQECIKLLTRQFTPIQGTFIYNAMSATSLVLIV